MQYNYKIMLHKEPDGGYTVTVPSLPGCITYGENVEELLSRGEDIPDDSNTLEYSLNLVRA